MTRDQRYAVWLYDRRVGTLLQRGDYTVFSFVEGFFDDPDRYVLGMVFEQAPGARHASALRLPPWFSNLLPEGQLRDWIASDRGVRIDREMELLAQVGHDLPGAVRVLPDTQVVDGGDDRGGFEESPSVLPGQEADARKVGWRFSLAGVGLKFSMLRHSDRMVLPAFGEGGDWIVKLPDGKYGDVPRNEQAMMTLAAAAGLDVPDHMLIHRRQLSGLPDSAWTSEEEYAYAVRRFDRGSDRELIHIEDFAQVRNVYPYANGKYQGNFETVASICYRHRDIAALQEFARRLAFNVLICNGDAHLKNWSLIYPDRRNPTLSPVYDLVSTAHYRVGDDPEDLGLKFHGSRRFELASLYGFRRLEERLGAPNAKLAEHVEETVRRVVDAWPTVADLLDGNPSLQDDISRSIDLRRRTLLRIRTPS